MKRNPGRDLEWREHVPGSLAPHTWMVDYVPIAMEEVVRCTQRRWQEELAGWWNGMDRKAVGTSGMGIVEFWGAFTAMNSRDTPLSP